MLLLFEEIAVEAAMIVATLVALGVLVYVLAGFALEHARARQESTASLVRPGALAHVHRPPRLSGRGHGRSRLHPHRDRVLRGRVRLRARRAAPLSRHPWISSAIALLAVAAALLGYLLYALIRPEKF